MKKLNLVIGLAAALGAGAALANGSVKGTISYTGAAVKPEMLKRKGDAFCAKKDFADETVQVSKDGKALANVLVRIKNAPAGAAAPTTPVVVDQQDCMYRPRVQGAVEGQKIEFKNSDQTMHNVHAFSGTKTLFNAPQQPKAAPMDKEAKGATDVVKLQCDVHPWMKGYVVYSKSPLFATSGTDGSFEIKDVPPGKYTIEAWHEKLGTQTAEVTVEDGKAADPKISFK
jgi:plastocyanin